MGFGQFTPAENLPGRVLPGGRRHNSVHGTLTLALQMSWMPVICYPLCLIYYCTSAGGRDERLSVFILNFQVFSLLFHYRQRMFCLLSLCLKKKSLQQS